MLRNKGLFILPLLITNFYKWACTRTRDKTGNSAYSVNVKRQNTLLMSRRRTILAMLPRIGLQVNFMIFLCTVVIHDWTVKHARMIVLCKDQGRIMCGGVGLISWSRIGYNYTTAFSACSRGRSILSAVSLNSH